MNDAQARAMRERQRALFREADAAAERGDKRRAADLERAAERAANFYD